MTTGGSKAGSKANDIPASQLKGPFYMIENGDCKQVAVVKQLQRMQESFQNAADTDRMSRDQEFREFVYENVPKIIERFMYLREREASEDVSIIRRDCSQINC